MEEAIEEFRDILDPFPVWLRSQLHEVGQGWVETAALVARYQERLGRRGAARPISRKAVAIAMKDSFPNAVPEQRRVGGTGKGGALTTATGTQARALACGGGVGYHGASACDDRDGAMDPAPPEGRELPLEGAGVLGVLGGTDGTVRGGRCYQIRRHGCGTVGEAVVPDQTVTDERNSGRNLCAQRRARAEIVS